VPVVVEAVEQPREGGGADPGGGFDLEDSAGGQRHPGHRHPGGFPGFSRGVQRVGLAGAGLADHDLHARPGTGELGDHRLLLAGQVPAG
jgi:hypothetical protein